MVEIPKKGDIITVFRNEQKFLLSYGEYIYLRELLGSVLNRDSNGKNNGEYYIRSLYYDTIYNQDHVNKIVGTSERKKIRFRIYSTDTTKVKVEIKNKYASYSVKETGTMLRADVEELINGNTDILLSYDNKVINKVYGYFKKDIYKPAVIVDYEREAFLSPVEKVRITFDKNIRASKSDRLFDKNIPMLGLHSQNVVVLEVKYNHYLPPYISQMISCCTGQRMSISKYCTAREMLY